MEYDKTYTANRTFVRPSSTVYNPRETRTSTYAPWVPSPVYSSGRGSGADFVKPETRRFVGETEWQRKIDKSQYVAHPYLRVGETFDYGNVILESPSPVIHQWSSLARINGKVRLTGPAVGLSTTPPPNVSTATSPSTMLKTSAVAEAKTGALQALVSLMEGPKTLQMITATASNLAHLLHVARRRLAGSTKEVKQLLDRIEVHGLQDGLSVYLQWRYGWRILLLEIDAAFRALGDAESYVADVLHRNRDTDDVGGTVTGSVTTYHDWSATYYCSRGGLTPNVYYRRETRTQRVRGSAVVYYLITSDAFQARNLTLSFTPTLWELIPYSYVYDWFTNVGDWLAAYAQTVPGLTWQGGVYSELNLTETTYEVTHGQYGTPLVPLAVQAGSMPARHQKFRFERSLWNPAEPLPPVVFNEMTIMRCLDAVALVAQRMNSLSRDAAAWRFKLPRK